MIFKDSDSMHKTSIIELPEGFRSNISVPKVFVCIDGMITEYTLSGRQSVGRPSDESFPDIPIKNRYVSRSHGSFLTSAVGVEYTADETTNGIFLNGELVPPGETRILRDGDELSISFGNDSTRNSVTLVIALSESRILLWQSLIAASKDNLTGLSSRDNFINWWSGTVNSESYSSACLFIMDIDDFKHINDSYGHIAGDKALEALARVLISHVRTTAQVCRWGGDEFVGIIPGSIQTVRQRMESIFEDVASLRIDGNIIFTISAGLVDTSSVKDRSDINSIVALADRALYKAKRSGKGKLCVLTGEEADSEAGF